MRVENKRVVPKNCRKRVVRAEGGSAGKPAMPLYVSGRNGGVPCSLKVCRG